VISVNNLAKEFGSEVLFENVSFAVNAKERIGLAGRNGAGKSTLMKIMTGTVKASNGEIVVPANVNVGYLPQEMAVDSSKKVIDEAMSVFSDLDTIKKKLRDIEVEIGQRKDYESKAFEKLLEHQEILHHQLHMAQPEKQRGNAEKVLQGLGFSRDDLFRSVSVFSFGWKMRVELGKLLLAEPELLLLDEPTNHLDIESIEWLEDYLMNYQGAVILVSHDRSLLDNLTTRTLEINNGTLYDYKVAYSRYIELREERQQHLRAEMTNQQREIREIERFIERFRYKNTKARQVQSRIKHLEKMDVIAEDDLDQSAIHFTFPPAPHSGKVTVEGKRLRKSYGEKEVFQNVDLHILKGERVAFVGRNGEGKTTLARIIAGKIDFEGSLKMGYQVITGYFSQDQWDMLDPEKTVFETLDEIAVGDIRKRLRTILGAFLFQGDDIDKKVSVLSGGEKSRLSLAKLLLVPTNLLILDEPTNHLDLISKDILKTALLQYSGTLILVSHDRDFLEGLTNRLYEFRGGKVSEFRGDINEFLHKRKLKKLAELEAKEKDTTNKESATTSVSKVSWEKKKEQERQLRKLNTHALKIEESISVLEKKIAGLNKKLADPVNHEEEIRSGDLYREHGELNAELEKMMNEWEDVHNSIERLEQKD
jgi:ATP-binding cassette subfamily F protein 3